MLELQGISILGVFFAGILTFLAPCTFPLIPAYLGFISGVDENDLKDPEKASQARRTIFLNGLFFVIGFSLVFIIFGVIVGLLGSAIAKWQVLLTQIGGAFVIMFGLFMLGLLKLPIFKTGSALPVPKWLTIGKPSSSFMIGATFAFGWTPCVGPLLASVLFLATSTSTVFSATLLLTVFSLGLALPFLFVAVAFSKAIEYIQAIEKYLNIISKIGGILLVILGYLLLAGNFNLLLDFGQKILEAIGLGVIYDFL